VKAWQPRNIALAILAGGLIIGCSLWGWRAWERYKTEDDVLLKEHRAQALKVVNSSRFGSQELRDQIASDFLEKIVTTQTCNWSGHSTWNGDEKNPNWFSYTKGSNGMVVTCETSAIDEEGHEDKLVFKWKVTDSRGVEGFEWGYSAFEDFE
jgi:hypothetical protein